MIATETQRLKFLDAQHIVYQRVVHPPSFCVEQRGTQMFGRYHGIVQADDGEVIRLACRRGLIGFAEEHHAKW
jgi:hypothetical protein